MRTPYKRNRQHKKLVDVIGTHSLWSLHFLSGRRAAPGGGARHRPQGEGGHFNRSGPLARCFDVTLSGLN
jgi:hypothetical protein